MADKVLKCLVSGSGNELCQLAKGHDGAHRRDSGPGCTIWFSPSSRWDHTLRRWVKPSESEYETGLDRLRQVAGPPRPVV
jgi:hypothetical protein